MQVFLDLDGPLVNLTKGLLIAHNLDISRIGEIKTWEHAGNIGLPVDYDEFWAPVIKQGAEFWANLEPTEYAQRIVDIAGPDATILSAPMRMQTGACIEGKVAWLEKHFPHLVSSAIFTKNKGSVSGSGKILLDDKHENCQDWNAAGGRAILWPCSWNIANLSHYWDPELAIRKLATLKKL